MNSNCGKAAVTLSEESVILHRLFESETEIPILICPILIL